MKHRPLRGLCTLVVGIGLLVIGSAPVGAERVRGAPESKTAKVLFGLNAASGSFTPTGEARQYTLSLAAVSGETIWFTDRPLRHADSVPTDTALDLIGFGDDGDGPPNAVMTFDADGGHEIVAVTLRNPEYDAAAATLTLQATLLRKPAEGLAGFNERFDRNPSATFTSASLFIDDQAVTITPGGQPVPQSTAANDCPVTMGSVFWGTVDSFSGITCNQLQFLSTQFGHPQVQCQNYREFDVPTGGRWTCQDQGSQFPYFAAAGNTQYPNASFYFRRPR